MAKITVVGSVNLDLVAACPRLPSPGETVTGARLSRHPGGKGANQALAARRMGAAVNLIGSVGVDAEAGEALALLAEAGVDLGAVRRNPDEPTGVALIAVGEDGENQIVVAPGANEALEPGDVSLQEADAVICQLEIPMEVVDEAARQAAGGLFFLNAAPASRLSRTVLDRADVIVVNEIENATLSDDLSGFGGLLVVTAGAAGAAAFRRGREVGRAASPAVRPVDTVGAGDAFVGALAVGLVEGMSPVAGLRLACAAGALATTRPGAQPSLPLRAEVDRLAGT